MRFGSGVCALCGRVSGRLSAWTHRDLVGVRYVPRYTVALTQACLCPDCLRSEIREAEAASDTPRLTIAAAGAVALAIGLASVAGPPFWPAVFRWLRGPSPEETTAALQQAYGAPVIYKPHVLVPPTQGDGER